MKWFIFTLLIALKAFAQNEVASDNELKGKFVAAVKDSEIEGMLERTKEFTDCYNQFKFKKEDTEAENEKKIKDAESCFNGKVTSGKTSEQLKELADKLNLESYGLIKSKNVSDITNYLTDKMHKAMTGYSRDEKDKQRLIESMKFKNRKMVDQSIFINLYKSQLSKSALQEMTRYCFEDFRTVSSSNNDTTFHDHWEKLLPTLNPDKPLDLKDINDKGVPKFSQGLERNLEDKEKVYSSIIKTVASKKIDSIQLNNFFLVCVKSMNGLCEEYKKKVSPSSATTATTNNPPADNKGAKSCLVMGKLQEVRKALAQTDKVIEDFNKLDGQGAALLLDGNQMANMYDPSKDSKNSLDKLTAHTSQDVLEGNYESATQELAEKCSDPANASDQDCDKFFIQSDSHLKAEHDLKMQMIMRKQVQMARVKALKEKDKQSLKEYLIAEGFHDLAEKVEKDEPIDIEDEVGKIYEARKEAAIEEFKNKVGKRQISEEELKKDPNQKNKRIQENAQTSKEERTRLAQVVLFNNIIMGSINLQDTLGKTLGKNISGLEQEVSQISTNIPGLQSGFFSGLKSDVDESGGNSALDNSVLGATDLIDTILGKDPDKK